MKQTAILTTTSLLSILFMTFHLTDDILFKMARPGLVNLFAVLIFVVWLYGTMAPAERRAGYHHFPRVALGVGRPCRPREGSRRRCRWRDRQVQRSLLLRVDTPRVRSDRDVLRSQAAQRTPRRTAALRTLSLKDCSYRHRSPAHYRPQACRIGECRSSG